MSYNHGDHAGNAGDVWKHFILAEVAEYLLAKEKALVYIESHVGYPEYSLELPGEWQDGIERCWNRINVLRRFSYFGILEAMNPNGLRNYPGSASIVKQIASKVGLVLEADVWDINPQVAASWHKTNLPDLDGLRFHFGDGFSGVRSLMERHKAALLLIDPPHLERMDFEKAVDILERATRSGWTALLWQMTDDKVVPDTLFSGKKYFINFTDVGLRSAKWCGATMTLVGSSDLHDFVNSRVLNFLKIMRHPEPI